MVVCPSCGSSRVRNGYKPAPFWLRMIGMRGLLCDNCNFPFRAFSPLPPKSRRPQHAQRKADTFNAAPVVDLSQIQQKSETGKHKASVAAPPVEKLELKIAPAPAEKFEFVNSSSSVPASARLVTDHIAPVHSNLRTEITKITAPGNSEIIKLPHVKREQHAKSEPHSSSHPCPECSSRNVRRRRRNFLERTLLTFSEHKAYNCRDCGAAFYAKSDERETRPSSTIVSDAASVESSCFNSEQRAQQKG